MLIGVTRESDCLIVDPGFRQNHQRLVEIQIKSGGGQERRNERVRATETPLAVFVTMAENEQRNVCTPSHLPMVTRPALKQYSKTVLEG